MNKTANELRAALKSSVVKFTFTKLNGEKREARGTTNGDLIPEEYRTKYVSKPSSNKVVTYFDLDVNGFRNVSVDSKISF